MGLRFYHWSERRASGHRDSNRNCNGHRHPDRHRNCDGHIYRHLDRNCNGHCDSNRN